MGDESSRSLATNDLRALRAGSHGGSIGTQLEVRLQYGAQTAGEGCEVGWSGQVVESGWRDDPGLDDLYQIKGLTQPVQKTFHVHMRFGAGHVSGGEVPDAISQLGERFIERC